MLHSLKREKREGKKEKQVLCVAAAGVIVSPQRGMYGEGKKSLTHTCRSLLTLETPGDNTWL
jgi:hypothetical protein